MKKVLITGCNGQVGWDLQHSLAGFGELIAVDRQTLDLSLPDTIGPIIQKIRPDIIVNAAAYTAVDKAESEKDLAMVVNGLAPGVLAKEAKKLNALLVHYSTDYIFDGSSQLPYKENDRTDPLNTYGHSKLVGEQAIRHVNPRHLILRTSWVYASRGKNFLLTMLKLAKEREMLKIVNDQYGAPTWSRAIADATRQILSSVPPYFNKWGTYHLTCSGKTSWLDFADKIFYYYSQKNPGFKIPQLTGIPSAEYPTPAKRPSNSLLSHQKLNKTFGFHMPHWEKSLELCLQEL